MSIRGKNTGWSGKRGVKEKGRKREARKRKRKMESEKVNGRTGR
jgi:hypothetical protein